MTRNKIQTTKSHRDNEYYLQRNASKPFARFESRTDYKNFCNQYWPYTNHLFNPIPNCFLSQIHNHHLLLESDTWFVRDGFLGIHSFFSRFPRPLSDSPTLCIDHNLKGLVPIAWRKKIQYWEICTLLPKSAITTIIMGGLSTSTLTSLDELKKSIFQIQKEMYRFSNINKLFAFLPIFHSRYDNNELFHFRYFSELLKSFDIDIEPINFSQLKYKMSFNGTLYFNLNSRNIISDDFMSALVLSRQGMVHGVSKLRNRTLAQKLSPHHGYILTDDHATELEIQKAISLKMILKENQNYKEFF